MKDRRDKEEYEKELEKRVPDTSLSEQEEEYTDEPSYEDIQAKSDEEDEVRLALLKKSEDNRYARDKLARKEKAKLRRKATDRESVPIDEEHLTPKAKLYLTAIRKLEVIPPGTAGKYSNFTIRYHIGEDDSVLLSEKARNLATVLAEHDKITYDKAYVMAGYAYNGIFNERKARNGDAKNDKERIKATLTARCKYAMVPKVTAYMNYIKYGASEQLLIDATWVLNESVNLYQEVKRKNLYGHAIKLLDSIATHTDVDAKATNKVAIVDDVDYAAILSQADDRVGQDRPYIDMVGDTKELPNIISVNPPPKKGAEQVIREQREAEKAEWQKNRKCRECKASITDYHHSATLCSPCKEVYQGNMKPIREKYKDVNLHRSKSLE